MAEIVFATAYFHGATDSSLQGVFLSDTALRFAFIKHLIELSRRFWRLRPELFAFYALL